MSAHAFFRHALATLAYRAAKTLRDAPPGFAEIRAGSGCRTAREIVGHLGDLMEWANRAAQGDSTWRVEGPQPWQASVDRFFAELESLDRQFAQGDSIECRPEELFQGPVADALTHVGQLATLRRLAGSPVRGESYRQAKIEVGRVGLDQAAPVREYD